MNTIGMVCGHHGNFICNWDSTRWKDYEVIGSLLGPDNKQGTLPQNPNKTVQLKTVFASTCQDPAAAMRVCDYMASEDGAKLAFWGVEGHDWRQPSEGAVDIDGQPATYCVIPTEERPENFLDGLVGHGWPTYQSAALNAKEADPDLGYSSAGEKFSSRYYEALYNDYLLPADEYWPSVLYFDGEALDELALLQTDLDNTVKLAEAEFVMGTRDIDADWDAYINDLKSNGLEKYLEISQQQYEANQK